MTSFVLPPILSLWQENKMQRQKVFFFAARIEGSDTIADLEDLRKMAVNYVGLYGESCLNDPETPSFVRHLLAPKSEVEMPRAG
jgi:hypothetical protein